MLSLLFLSIIIIHYNVTKYNISDVEEKKNLTLDKEWIHEQLIILRTHRWGCTLMNHICGWYNIRGWWGRWFIRWSFHVVPSLWDISS